MPSNDTIDETSTEHTRSGLTFRPDVDILEMPDKLIVQADMPGASGESVDIQFEDGSLTIHAHVKPRHADVAHLSLQEFGVGDFFRTFRVSEHIDAARITADYRDGVLTLHLPKAESAKPRKIQVQSR